VVLEYCGPNTNKPLHLGHIRNLVIGYSMANILQAHGDEVHKVNIYNDRGIAICKSMIAWLKTGKGETPESSGIKGDHFIGKYYVKFAEMHAEQVEKLVAEGMDKEQAKKEAPIQKEAQELLLKWEANDPETVDLWLKMNNWVYEGFEETYDKLGVDFEKHYYESETYLKGREMVLDGLDQGIFVKKEDGSVWADLTDEGLDEKLLLRSDGTSVYLTQDIGTAEARYEDYTMDQSIYTVANEQEYHFKALQLVLQQLGKPYWEGIYHLSYGMVDLPTGKMKSREGTTVDADDLYQQMLDIAENNSQELGKLEGMSESEQQQLYRQLGLGALKYFLLRVNAKKRILFDPEANEYRYQVVEPELEHHERELLDMLFEDIRAPLIYRQGVTRENVEEILVE
jgi:arginyl-tRNA synthetase